MRCHVYGPLGVYLGVEITELLEITVHCEVGNLPRDNLQQVHDAFHVQKPGCWERFLPVVSNEASNF